jgi:hypothetical protein
MHPNVRGHRADGMKDATGSVASEAPGGPRCWAAALVHEGTIDFAVLRFDCQIVRQDERIRHK